MSRYLDYLYIVATIAFTVYGQLILKARVVQYGPMPGDAASKLRFLLSLFLDPYILSGIAAAFIASLAWMAAMTKFDLSHAYPFMSLNFAIVLVFSVLFLSEPLTVAKTLGIGLIIIGTVVAARG